MLVALDINQTIEYISQRDKKWISNPDPDPDSKLRGHYEICEPATVFQLAVMDEPTRGFVRDTAFVTDPKKRNLELEADDAALQPVYRRYVQFGLKGWSNMMNAQGHEVSMKTEEISTRVGKKTIVAQESIDLLDVDLIQELGTQILGLNSMRAKDAEKNS